MMKKVILMAALAVFALAGCDKGSDSFEFNAQSLEQTTWEGEVVVTDSGKVVESKSIRLQFYTIGTGIYVTKQAGYSNETTDFDYSIDKKMMDIIAEGSLNGKYLLLEFSKSKMVLETFGDYTVTITLHRK